MKRLLFLILVAPCYVHAQDKVDYSRYIYNCSSITTPSAGCTSYDQLIKSGDKALLSIVTKSPTFACFRPYEDVFFLVAFSEPNYDAFTKNPKTGGYEANAFVFYDRFNKGISEESRFFAGKWKKFMKDGETPLFHPLPGDEGHGVINDSEIGVQYYFTNLSNTKTTYSVMIRRSTLRFLESYQWENPPHESKGKGKNSSQSDPPMGTNETGGYCAYFPTTSN